MSNKFLPKTLDRLKTPGLNSSGAEDMSEKIMNQMTLVNKQIGKAKHFSLLLEGYLEYLRVAQKQIGTRAMSYNRAEGIPDAIKYLENAKKEIDRLNNTLGDLVTFVNNQK